MSDDDRAGGLLQSGRTEHGEQPHSPTTRSCGNSCTWLLPVLLIRPTGFVLPRSPHCYFQLLLSLWVVKFQPEFQMLGTLFKLWHFDCILPGERNLLSLFLPSSHFFPFPSSPVSPPSFFVFFLTFSFKLF